MDKKLRDLISSDLVLHIYRGDIKVLPMDVVVRENKA
jgi:hypothetical protein